MLCQDELPYRSCKLSDRFYLVIEGCLSGVLVPVYIESSSSFFIENIGITAVMRSLFRQGRLSLSLELHFLRMAHRFQSLKSLTSAHLSIYDFKYNFAFLFSKHSYFFYILVP